jgi:hypothetical protein
MSLTQSLYQASKLSPCSPIPRIENKIKTAGLASYSDDDIIWTEPSIPSTMRCPVLSVNPSKQNSYPNPISTIPRNIHLVFPSPLHIRRRTLKQLPVTRDEHVKKRCTHPYPCQSSSIHNDSDILTASPLFLSINSEPSTKSPTNHTQNRSRRLECSPICLYQTKGHESILSEPLRTVGFRSQT